jgi:hypothetical protein
VRGGRNNEADCELPHGAALLNQWVMSHVQTHSSLARCCMEGVGW